MLRDGAALRCCVCGTAFCGAAFAVLRARAIFDRVFVSVPSCPITATATERFARASRARFAARVTLADENHKSDGYR